MPFPKIGKAIVASATVLALLGGHSWAQRPSDLVLVQAQGGAVLENSKWAAIGIYEGALNTEKRPELTFESGGAFGGSGGCNRFRGQAEISGEMIDFPDNIAATLMACPPEIEDVERRFFDALQGVSTYLIAGDSLVMLDGAGEPALKFMRVQ